jgi:glycosyltransferase involved in cell wall biosynthesis
MTPPWITVAVCTRNRATLLGAALERLAITGAPAGLAWEVVVVDNGSTDRTPAVIQAFGARLPLRSVREPRPGVSHARNAAVAAAAGTYVLWLDDDELVSPGWLTDYVAAARACPSIEAFGGPIVPWYESWGTTPPPWLARAMRVAPGLAGSYSALDLGPTPRLLTPTEYLWNGNLMVRTVAHQQVPYDGAFGRRPGSRRGGEEVEFLDQLRARGASARWVPSAWVHHVIPLARQTVRYLRWHYQGYGEMKAIHQRRETGHGLSRRERLRLWEQHVRHAASFRVRRLTSGPEHWIESLIFSAYVRGRLRTDRTLRRGDADGSA